MKNKPILLCDVDNTVVNTLNLWAYWAKQTYGVDLDFSKHIEEERLVAYWKKDNLYDNLAPISEAVESLRILSQKYRIIFVSHCYPSHLKSKIRFLLKYFEFEGFLDADFVTVPPSNVVIDDRYNLFEKARVKSRDTICILRESEYAKEEDKKQADYILPWSEITHFLMQQKFD